MEQDLRRLARILFFGRLLSGELLDGRFFGGPLLWRRRRLPLEFDPVYPALTVLISDSSSSWSAGMMTSTPRAASAVS